jgi:hypothetical protein
MEKYSEGDVVIVATGQAGTVCAIGRELCVFLANGDLWYGMDSTCRFPQDKADLDAAPREVDRFKGR